MNTLYSVVHNVKMFFFIADNETIVYFEGGQK